MSVQFHSAALLIALLLAAPPLAAAAPVDNTLAAARDLYAAAAYEDALVILNQLTEGSHGPDEERAIQQYRAFCLLALGRTEDAEDAIEAVVAAQPRYQPSNTDLSPRILTTFVEVRRRVLPTVIQQQYAIAKAAYDNKNYPEAVQRFTHVLEVLGDPDVRSAAAQPPLSDLKVLASGFRDLAVIAATPPPPPPVPAPEPPPPAGPAVPAAPRVYSVADRDVVPPIIIRQSLPSFPLNAARPAEAVGVLEVLIDEKGAVEQALMRQPLNATYDRQAVNAARGWRYQPATVNGVPVKFRKFVQINIQK